MTKFTDKNIPITCWECIEDHQEEGLQAMVEHLREAHEKQYPTLRLATATAEDWLETAYDREDANEEAYAKDQAFERKLNKLRGKP